MNITMESLPMPIFQPYEMHFMIDFPRNISIPSP